jgi:lipopolysaccharide export system protein LptC
MKPRTRILYIALSIGVTVSVALWITEEPQVALYSSATRGVNEDIRAEIYGAEFLQYNEQGELAADITSLKATHYTLDNRISFAQPVLTLAPADTETLTRVTAGAAELKVDDKLLTLHDDVLMEQLSPQGVVLTTLHTQTLKYDQEQHFISTDQLVTITRDNAEIQATGLEAWLDLKKMTLLSKVTGRYVPN